MEDEIRNLTSTDQRRDTSDPVGAETGLRPSSSEESNKTEDGAYADVFGRRRTLTRTPPGLNKIRGDIGGTQPLSSQQNIQNNSGVPESPAGKHSRLNTISNLQRCNSLGEYFSEYGFKRKERENCNQDLPHKRRPCPEALTVMQTIEAIKQIAESLEAQVTAAPKTKTGIRTQIQKLCGQVEVLKRHSIQNWLYSCQNENTESPNSDTETQTRKIAIHASTQTEEKHRETDTIKQIIMQAKNFSEIQQIKKRWPVDWFTKCSCQKGNPLRENKRQTQR